jgi:hypothetical protein
MESFDGLDTLHMSGARAVFTLGKGADLTEEDFAAAFEEQGMKLETFGEQERPRAKALYAVDAGIT